MTKSKAKKLVKATVDVWEAFTCMCPHCEEYILIREPVRQGDVMTCPNCESARLTIGSQYADYRKGDGKVELSATGLGPFLD